MNNIDLNLYKIFITLYEQRSISKTANIMYVSQPAISYSLKELENQLGYNLFHRTARGIEPTIEALTLYNYISTAFNIIRDGEECLKDLNELNIGEVRIGVPSNIAVYFLSSLIADFRKIYPGIKFEVVSKSTTELVDLLETRNIDLIIDALPINTNNRAVKKKILVKFQNCFVYNKKVFGKINIINTSDLKKYPLILPVQTSSIRLKLDEYMDGVNVKLHPVIEAGTTEFMLEMVRNGSGIGYVIKEAIEMNDDKEIFDFVLKGEKLPIVEVCAVYLEEFETKALKKFLEFLNSNCSKKIIK